jgi:hypothetical protein
MKLKYCSSKRLESGMMVFVGNAELIAQERPSLKTMYGDGVDIHAHYAANEDIEWLGNICIPQRRWGNLGPHGDMVYFGSGASPDAPDNDYTIAIPIELLLLHPEAFSPRSIISHRVSIQ